MSLVLTSGPASEPITVDEAKTHVRIDGTDEDALITSLIMTSRLHVETALGLALMTQSWTLFRDAWPRDGIVELPLSPLQAVTAVRTLGSDETPTVVDAASYVVDIAGKPPRIVPNGIDWPRPGKVVNGIEIEFTAGYGPNITDVPAPIRQALLMLVAHWYEHRDPIEIGSPSVAIPSAVSRLLKPYRKVRL